MKQGKGNTNMKIDIKQTTGVEILYRIGDKFYTTEKIEQMTSV